MAVKGNSEKKSHKVGLSQFLLDAPHPPPSPNVDIPRNLGRMGGS
jgi:hypothetical protein